MRKKIYVLLLMIAMILPVVGCDESESEKVDGTVENSKTKTSEEDSGDEKDDTNTINKEIVNDDNFRATLVEIKKVNDDIWGNSIEIKFELENKSDLTVEVQGREVSVDGKMVDESMLSMSQEISPGKTADGVLTIEEYEGTELPKMEEELEMILHAFSWDDMDYEHDYPLKISFSE